MALLEDAALREIAMGAWEGLTHAEAMQRYPEACAAWEADALHNAPPGGETLARSANGSRACSKTWYERYPEGSVLWVTHGGLIGVLLCQVLGMSLDRRWQFRRDNAALNELEIGDDWAVVTQLNDTTHLADLQDTDEREHRQIL